MTAHKYVFMTGRWVCSTKELQLDFELEKLLPNNLLLRCWISQHIFAPCAPGIPIKGDSRNITEHRKQVWKDAHSLSYLNSCAMDCRTGPCHWNSTAITQLVLLLTAQSVNLFQDRYIMFFLFEFTSPRVTSLQWHTVLSGNSDAGKGCFLLALNL